MTTAIGVVLMLLAVVVAVLQVRWIARSPRRPAGWPDRWWRLSDPLPPMQRHGSDLAIAALVLGGAFALEQGRPGWTFYAAAVAGAAVVAVAQVLAVRAAREPVGR